MKKILILLIFIIIILGIFGILFLKEQKELDVVKQEELKKEQEEIALLEELILIQVYIKSEVEDESIKEIGEEIEQINHVKQIEFISKWQALELMKEALNENADILEGFEGENNIFPASYIVYCEIDDIDNLYYDEIIKKIENIDGIDQVRCNYESILYYYENDMLEELKKIN